MRLIDLAQGNLLENFQGGRGRDRETAVGAVDDAVAFVEMGDEDFLHSQCFDADTGADDISDRVERAHFMKLHVLGWLSMDFAFGDRDTLENTERVLLYKRREIARSDQGANGAMIHPMRMFVVGMPMIVGMPVIVIASRAVVMGFLMDMRGDFVAVSDIEIRAGMGRMKRLPMGMRGVLMVVVAMRTVFVPAVFAVGMFVFAMGMPVGFVLIVRVNGAGMDGELDALDSFALFPLKMHVEIADLQLGKFPLEGGGVDAKIA